jgi:hypothetical protein
VKLALQRVYNLLLISGRLPAEWNSKKTILIPKRGKDLSKPENYRPITIGSLLSRLFWGILDKRLRERTVLSPRQQGFTNESGCFNNVHILNEVLQKAKKKSGIVVIN